MENRRKMKNIIKYITIQMVVILAFGACSDDFFKENPSDKITPDQYYNSIIDAELSCLAPLKTLQEYAPYMVFANDLLADLTVATNNADLYWQEVNTHNVSVDNPYIDPSPLYKVIINANEALKYIDAIANKDRDMTEIYLDIYKGNLIGVRSWAYFTIARLFGEVAYIKDNLEEMPTEDFTYIPRKAIMDTLINDLLPYLEIDYVDIGTYSMYNKALIGEIYLEKQDYANAVTYLKMAIEGFSNTTNIFKVTTSLTKDNWKDIFIYSYSEETMIDVPYSVRYNQLNEIEAWYRYNDDYIAKPTNYIVNLFDSQITLKNKTGDMYRGLGISYDTIDNGNLVVNKYNLAEGDKNQSSIILYRAGDVHLLLAEALNRSGETEIALSIMNDGYNKYKGWSKNAGIRGRAYLKNIDEIPSGVDVTNYVEDLIMQERALELAFEGKRWFDLMRVARRRGANYLADKVAAKYSDPTVASQVREKLKNEANWYLPVKK